MIKNIKKFIGRIEHHKYLNLRNILFLYLITRIFIIILLNYGVWNSTSMLCYTADCKMYWWNVNHMIHGENPYKIWIGEGNTLSEICHKNLPERSDFPPIFFLFISTFVWIWKNVWAMYLMFFIFDSLNILLIYNLSKFKHISVVLYIFAPLVLRGLIFPEDEIFSTFLLASIYFLKQGRYSLSTLMLTISANIKFFPIILLPALFLGSETIRRVDNGIFPQINFKMLIKQLLIFIGFSLIAHIFYFPYNLITYKCRMIHNILIPHGEGIWRILPGKYFPFLIGFLLLIFYLYSYTKKTDIKTMSLFASLLFISLYTDMSFDNLTFLIPLFLIWTRLNFIDLFSWILFSIASLLDILALPTIGVIEGEISRITLEVMVLVSLWILFLSNKYNK